jgi:uncharacterized protein (TIGR00251 family)
MRFTIIVKPNAKQVNIKTLSEKELIVSVDAPPHEGKANKRLLEILANHFGVAKSQVQILKGEHTKKKIVEILLH